MSLASKAGYETTEWPSAPSTYVDVAGDTPVKSSWSNTGYNVQAIQSTPEKKSYPLIPDFIEDAPGFPAIEDKWETTKKGADFWAASMLEGSYLTERFANKMMYDLSHGKDEPAYEVDDFKTYEQWLLRKAELWTPPDKWEELTANAPTLDPSDFNILPPETLDEIKETTGKLKIPAGSKNVYVQDPNTGEWGMVTTDKPSTFLATQWIAANNSFFQSDFLTGHKLRNEQGGYDPSPGQDNPLWDIVGRQPEMIEGMTDFLNQTYELDIEIDADGNLRGVVDWTVLAKGDPYITNTLEELGYINKTTTGYGPGGYGGGYGYPSYDGGGGGSVSPKIQSRRARLQLTSWRI